MESQGFIVDPCDPCVTNKMINGHQFTVVWHVDDLKCSHVDHSEVEKFIEWLCETCEDDVGNNFRSENLKDEQNQTLED